MQKNNAGQRTGDTRSAAKVLEVLKVLQRNFAHGFSPSELVKETGFSPSDITRYVNTLETQGFAERIPETGRVRMSHRHAQVGVQALNSLNAAQERLGESMRRIGG